jgi:hypothetical protein
VTACVLAFDRMIGHPSSSSRKRFSDAQLLRDLSGTRRYDLVAHDLIVRFPASGSPDKGLQWVDLSQRIVDPYGLNLPQTRHSVRRG